MKAKAYLTKEGKAIQAAIVKHLEEAGQLKDIDADFVSMCANSCYLAEKYAAIVNKEGAVQEFATGAQNVSGAYSIMHKEREAYARMCKALGITPEGREKISAFAAAKVDAKTHQMRRIKIAK